MAVPGSLLVASRRLALLVVGWLVFATTAVAQTADWDGVWDSRWRDGGATLYLQQDGDQVTGTYPTIDGTIRGEVRGRLLVGDWRDAAGSGSFVFSLAPDGESFSGRFGTGEWWTGVRTVVEPVRGELRADASTPRTAFRSFVVAGNAARDGRLDRMGPALAVLDFQELPAERAATPVDRLKLARELFQIIDQLTFRVWEVPVPAEGEGAVTATLHQAGTDESFRLRFRYGVRANGAAGWFIVMPEPGVMDRALERLLAHRGGELPHERAHHELGSPRATMRTFIEQYGVWEDTGDSELLFRTLNLGRIGPTARDDEAALRAQYLKQVIDRVGYVLWQEIPDNPDRDGVYTHFIHPEGRIEIGPVTTEDGERIWQFTPATLAAARPLYIALEDMPLDVGVDFDTSSVFLQIRDQVRAFDRRLLSTIGGVEIWQGVALVGFLLASVAVSWLVAAGLFRVILRVRREPDATMGVRTRFVLPLQVLLIAGFGLFAVRVLGLPETVDVPLRIVFGVLLSLAGGWFAYNLVDRIGRAASTASEGFGYRDEMLQSIAIALAKVVVVIGAILLLAEVLSMPWQGVVAGLSIGGLAIGLAARSTLENFIGGLTLLADKPIRVGDFCQFGGQLGTIEGLGLRSVKVRSLDRTVVTIPNGEFVNLYLENYSRRDSILLRTTLQLRYETTPDQLRWVLTQLRKLFLQHPAVLAEPSRARFVGFGAHSLDIELFAYVDTHDYNTYLAIQEDLFLRMIDIVEHSGTGFAFPSTVNYLTRDKGVDPERREEAEASIANLREQDRLPFPDFDEDERWDMFNQLEYPAPGSPHSRRAHERRVTAGE
ncbi:MAG: mechanosensitive ion channel [Alphaproteobacteria bacterium]|jgi:small-conductance mechanosensitive channel|nr:mechanosensitive ion channel [Alphaproteobacteria bacterium]